MAKYLIYGWKRRGPHIQKASHSSNTQEGAIRKARELTNQGFRMQICDGKKCVPWPSPGIGKSKK